MWRGSTVGQVCRLMGGRFNLLPNMNVSGERRGVLVLGFSPVGLHSEIGGGNFCCTMARSKFMSVVFYQLFIFVLNHKKISLLVSLVASAGFSGPGLLYSWGGGWIRGQSFGKSTRVSKCSQGWKCAWYFSDYLTNVDLCSLQTKTNYCQLFPNNYTASPSNFILELLCVCITPTLSYLNYISTLPLVYCSFLFAYRHLIYYSLWVYSCLALYLYRKERMYSH